MNKRKLLKAVSVGLAIAGGVSLAGPLLVMLALWKEGFSPAEAGSVGIIGGADGPTAVFVTGSAGPGIHWSWIIAAAMLILGIIGSVVFRKKEEKEE